MRQVFGTVSLAVEGHWASARPADTMAVAEGRLAYLNLKKD